MGKIKTATQILEDANYFTGEEEMQSIISLMEKYSEQFTSELKTKKYINTLLSSVSNKKIDLIKEYLEPTGITVVELMDRNAFASLCQLLDAYLLEAVRNRR